MASYDTDDDYSLVDWAEDREVVADPTCTTCWEKEPSGRGARARAWSPP